ncbi:LPS export ABC transporter periplasmic protein LptC [Solirhodobacter olei]|uniref:LPS export ABC transporter periplasmic protein LptC n=1 Tax=Solirhodobacter olei TaxID=2493082 RepID=UPI000FDB26DA|nr:LPS export ABC transporter periplasmic protein LptC [Solirhodobacter olei]
MGGRDNAYSRLVFWLKILLPLAALVILSTMFLVARTIDPSRAIPFAKVDVRSLAREPRITGPKYSSVTSDGSSLHITAAEARPEPARPGHATATNVVATLTSPAGQTTVLTSERGKIDTPGNLVTFDGKARVAQAGGYQVTAPHMEAALDKTHVLATGGVTATAPFGRITAAQMQITPDPAASGSYVLVFNGGVKLVYDPGKKR